MVSVRPTLALVVPRLIHARSLYNKYFVLCHFLSACLSHVTWPTHWSAYDRASKDRLCHQGTCTTQDYWHVCQIQRSAKPAVLPATWHPAALLTQSDGRLYVRIIKNFQAETMPAVIFLRHEGRLSLVDSLTEQQGSYRVTLITVTG
jgi:hypothetical protein